MSRVTRTATPSNVIALGAHRDGIVDAHGDYHVCVCGGHRFMLVTVTREGPWVALRTDGTVMAYSGEPVCCACGRVQDV